MKEQLPVDAKERIRRYVDVQKRPTVVRLEDLQSSAEWITASFYITHDIEAHLQALQHAFQKPTGSGIFLIGQYGAGKSHWLAYLTCQLQGKTFVPQPPDVIPVSLLNFRATTPLEDIVSSALQLNADGHDRREAWSQLQERHPHGILLLLDELSEFLRSKSDQRALNEDVRFLQFMGEWASGQRFWVLAAMQEGIEHTGELEHGLYRKIRDRFPMRMLLSPKHVKDLIQESVLVKQPGYREAVEALTLELREALPDIPIAYDDLRELCPLHPATLELLEEVRDCFSLARGAVDFAITQLHGDPARGVAPFLDKPWGTLLTPESIVDHFRNLFEVQPEFLGLAQQLFPYYRKHLPELFPSEGARELAERLLKLLVVVYLSPAREGFDVREAASWLLFRPTRVDPRKNLEILHRTLKTLTERGRYVVERDGRFRLELRDDGVANFEAFLQREKEELKGQGDQVLEQLTEDLGEEEFNPLHWAQDEWQQRSVRWHFHDREYWVYVGNGTPAPQEGAAVCLRLPWGAPRPAAGVATIAPQPLRLGEELLELAALLRASKRPWSRDVRHRVEARLKERIALFRSQLRAAYRDAEFFGPTGQRETGPTVDASAPLRQWLDQYAELLLKKTYPAFERFAPGHGPMPKEAYRSLMRFAAQSELGDYDADDYVKLIREAYLVPLRLLNRQGRNYLVPPNLERHELLTLLRPLLDLHPAPSLIYEHVGQSVYGLVPDQIGLLLVFLHILGEIDILKGRRSYRDLHETLPDPLQYDEIVPCTALSLDQLRDLQTLCDGLQIRGPKDWTVLAQRRAVKQVKETLTRQLEPLKALLLKTQGEDQAEELAGSLRQLLAWDQILRRGNDDLGDLQQFLFEIGSPRRFLNSVAELRSLSERVDRLLSERKRYQHLLHHPAMAAGIEPSLSAKLEWLQTAPSLAQPDAMEQWLRDSREAYEQYKQSYGARHEAWWQRVAADSIWKWQPPAIAASRHLGLGDVLEKIDQSRRRAERLRCPGLVNLDFQPLCACGFDGQVSPIQEELDQLRSSRTQVEQAVTFFFGQESVRGQMEQWVEQGLETNPRIQAYLRREIPFPEVSNLELFDRHLAGIELVKDCDPAAFLELLGERTWDKESLLRALTEMVARLPGPQLRFHKMPDVATPELARWCLEQALRFGVPLPPGLRGVGTEAADEIRPEWVSVAALRQLPQLGFGQPAIDQIVRGLLEQRVTIPPQANGLDSDWPPLVAAALEILRPSTPQDPLELADLAERLYRAHERLRAIAGQAWLDRLNAVAESPLTSLPTCAELIQQQPACQYLLIDCLGLPLLRSFGEHADEFLPDWKRTSTAFARVVGPSTTDACYRSLIDSGFDSTLEKINRVDDLVHQQSSLPFDDFARLAMAELGIACRAVRTRLDRDKPLVVFADHGFRIDPTGSRYTHGAESTLEQVVPVFRFDPR